ncbi:inositol 2-dehydrogenase [Porcincola sp. LCP21S3_C12]|uniref:inositol 2-dehydrogenase n=1 Tax=Porcincola sp. LCP21S3_C12 TaxID=3438798 RepID=UPI003F96D291
MDGVLRIGLIGMGRIGKLHGSNIQSLVKGAEIVCAADPYLNEDKERWAESVGIAHCSRDPEDIFRDPDIDAVFICSSTDTHADFIVRAAKAGKDIFCEKPIAVKVSDINRALRAVEEAGVKLQVGFVRRFDKSHKAVRDAAASGKIGKVYVVKVCSRDPEAPPMSYVEKSGGIFMDMMIHDFDMVRYLSGSEVTEVYAAGGCLVDSHFADYGDVDTAIVTLRFENGALGVIDNCRQAPYGYDQRVEVHGEKGCVRDENQLEDEARLATASGTLGAKPTWFFLERYNDAFVEEERAFVKACLSDAPVLVGGMDGLKAVLIAKAAKKSLETGRPVRLDDPDVTSD